MEAENPPSKPSSSGQKKGRSRSLRERFQDVAVHYPFLKTGWGFGVPSFLALLGLLVIISQLITPRFGQQAALWSILTLLSMPTLMLQATTTKNDLVVVFGAGCWIYSLVRFRRSRNNFFFSLQP
jgi:hypothetical protein